VPYPPPILLGSADCIANGDRFPLSVVRSLPGGVDSRCYQTAGQPVPVSPPGGMIFWLRPEELSSLNDGDPISKWADAGPYRNTPTSDPLGASPFWIAGQGGSLGAASFTAFASLSWAYPLNIGPNVSTYLAITPQQGFGSANLGGGLFGPGAPDKSIFAGLLNRILFGVSNASVTFGLPFMAGAPYVYFLRSAPGSATFGVVGGPSDTVAPALNAVTNYQHLEASGFGTIAGLHCQVNEAICWDRVLADDEHSAVLAYLAGRNYLPPQP
jgi:hypothetical protein